MSDPLLSASEIQVGMILRGLSFEVYPREVVRISGPSASGKTSLLRALVRATPLHQARIAYRRTLLEPCTVVRFRSEVQYVPASAGGAEETVERFLAEPFTFGAQGGKCFQRDRARELLDRLGLADVALDTSPATLSTGQLARLRLLRSLLTEPAVLLLDEPTASLDPDTARATLSTLFSLYAARSEEWGIVLVSHAGAASIQETLPPGIRFRELRMEKGEWK